MLLIWLSTCLVQESLIFYSCQQFPCYLVGLWWSLWVLSSSVHTVPTALQDTCKQPFPFHLIRNFPSSSAWHWKLFVTFFWIFLLGQFFVRKINRQNTTKQQTKQNKQTNKQTNPTNQKVWMLFVEEPLLRNNSEVKLPVSAGADHPSKVLDHFPMTQFSHAFLRGFSWRFFSWRAEKSSELLWVVGNKWWMNPSELSTFAQQPVICRGLALGRKVIPSNPMLVFRAKFLFLLFTKYCPH